MHKVKELEDLEILLKQHPMTIVFFSGSICSACQAIKLKLEQLLLRYPRIESRDIDLVSQKQMAAHFGVYVSPVFILFVEGKECVRVGSSVDFGEVEGILKRYYDLLY